MTAEILGVGLESENPEAYYARVRNVAADDVLSLVERYELTGKRLLSIGSGYGAEEDMFAECGVREVVCIEPDEEAAAFHETKKAAGVMVSRASLREFIASQPLGFDVIYTSSPSDWMYGGTEDAIPDLYLELLQKNGARTLFIARLYGGNFRTRVLKSAWFRKRLNMRLKKVGLALKEYWITANERDKNVATVVAWSGERPVRADVQLRASRFASTSMQLPVLEGNVSSYGAFIFYFQEFLVKLGRKLQVRA